MKRPLRLERPGARYHVTARADSFTAPPVPKPKPLEKGNWLLRAIVARQESAKLRL